MQCKIHENKFNVIRSHFVILQYFLGLYTGAFVLPKSVRHFERASALVQYADGRMLLRVNWFSLSTFLSCLYKERLRIQVMVSCRLEYVSYYITRDNRSRHIIGNMCR